MVEKPAADMLLRTALLPSNEDARRFADFFSHLRTADNEAILGEDQSFCKRWGEGCGGEIWVDGQSGIGHCAENVMQGQYGLSARNLS